MFDFILTGVGIIVIAKILGIAFGAIVTIIAAFWLIGFFLSMRK